MPQVKEEGNGFKVQAAELQGSGNKVGKEPGGTSQTKVSSQKLFRKGGNVVISVKSDLCSCLHKEN